MLSNDKHINIKGLEHVYFLGIGGIGMSALARYFNLLGIKVSGYDRTETPLTRNLSSEGMVIHFDENPSLIPADTQLVVYTPAIPESHSEWSVIRKLEVPVMKRAEVLGLISRNFRTIAVAGTHGKTSTSSMTSYFLRSGGEPVSGFLGGIVKDYDSNFVFGSSDWVVVEADEFDRSFMHLTPEIAVLLSLDADHLDIYGDHQEMLKTFRDFTLQIKNGGTLLVCQDIVAMIDKDWKSELLQKGINIFSFGVDEGWFSAQNVKVINHRFEFDFYEGDEDIMHAGLSMPGKHNTSNAIAALSVAKLVGADMEALVAGVDSFQGIDRRFDFQYTSDKLVYVDDYAHHPSELKAAIGAARVLYPSRKLTVIFQPHLYSRTRDFIEEFAQVLSTVDELILMDIYPARELPLEGVNSQWLLSKVTLENSYILNEAEVISWVEVNLDSLEVLMTLGAGNIDRIVKPIKEIILEGYSEPKATSV